MKNFRRFPRFRIFLTLSALTFASGCASVKERAGKEIASGNYEHAASLYERALRQNPGDAEAAEGLKKSRQQILGNRLIQVRQARLSGNQRQASELLLEIVGQEMQWSVSPVAAAHFTQEEEAGFAFPAFKAEILSLLRSNQPLAAEHSYRRFAPVFTGEKTSPAFDSLHASILTTGKQHCQELRKEAGAEVPYYGAFVSSYCGLWKVDFKNSAKMEGARLAEFYKEILWNGQITGLPPELQVHFTKALQEGFETSAWYDPSGAKKAPLQLSGSYTNTHDSALVSLLHYYDAQEPYEATEMVKKTRQVPYAALEPVLDATGKKIRDLEVTKYRAEEYQELQKSVKYRKIQKQHPYSALRHKQDLALNASVTSALTTKTLMSAVSQKVHVEGDEHNLSLPDIGLKPSRPTLLEPATWVQEQAAKLKADFSAKLSEAWIASYCVAGTGGRAETGERVRKCRRDKQAGAPAFINDWYVKYFGLGAAEAEKLIGL